MADVFISCASQDRSKVAPLSKGLENQGWSVFWDRVIPIKKSWRGVIESELKIAKCVVVIWTENSIANRWVLAEVNKADVHNILIQVLFENVDIPLPYDHQQAANLTDWKSGSSHPEFTRLLIAISETIDIRLN